MKKIALLFISLLASLYVFAQTPAQIASRMEAEMEKHKADGVHLYMELKIPIVGTFTTSMYQKGEKTRLEVTVADSLVITWHDGTTVWIYISPAKEVTIRNSNSNDDASTGGNLEMFSDITAGYNVSLSKETPREWYLTCKKSKANKDKEAPKKMELVVAKGTYYPVSLSTKMMGVTMTLRDITFGVSDEQVTFNPADYPGVTVKDERAQ